MKNLTPMTPTERQEAHRDNLKESGALRLSITLGPEAVAALEVIQNVRKKAGTCHTKRAAVEAALIVCAGFYSGDTRSAR